MKYLLIFLCFTLCACGSSRGGHIDLKETEVEVGYGEMAEVRTPAGEMVVPKGTRIKLREGKVQQPDNAETPATFSTEKINVSTGFSWEPSKLLGSYSVMTWGGILICLLGIGVFALSIKRMWGIKLPFPKWVGPAIFGLGIFLVLAPSFMEGIGQYIVGGIVLVVFVLVLLYALRKFGFVEKKADQLHKGLRRVRERSPDTWQQIQDMVEAEADEDVRKDVNDAR